jgi:exodeoxyribonuclease V gamma subunit
MESEESGCESLLHRLQDEILTLGTGESVPLPPMPDNSIRILACPNVRREAEVVANEIWQTLIESRGQIRFSDITVVLPEGTKEDYLDPIRVAFAETRQIPWRLADEGPSLIRELADGAILLLKLGLSDLNRAKVIQTLGHPAFMRRWPTLPLDELAEFCEHAGIVARMGMEDTKETYLEHGLWTWTRGFQRTAIGFFTGRETPMDWNGDSLPGAQLLDGSPDLAHFLQALLADVSRLKGTRQGPRLWAAQIREFLYGYLGPGECQVLQVIQA